MEPPESSTRELTLEEAVSVAILLQKNKQFLEAQEIYRRVLERTGSPSCAALRRRARASTGA